MVVMTLSTMTNLSTPHGAPNIPGALFFGVKNNGDVIGQEISETTLRDISQAVSNRIKPVLDSEIETKMYRKKVKSIGKLAFYGDKKLKTLVVRSAKLTKSGVQNSLKGSAVTTIKLSGSAAKAKTEKYAKIFKKSNSGKSIIVK